MRRAALLHILVWAMWCISAPSWAAERKAWVRLADCQYVAQAYNDGDSMHVHCGAQEFIVRLYFVDAPESNLRYPDRTREQSEYFEVTLDETLRAGRQPPNWCASGCRRRLSSGRAGPVPQAAPKPHGTMASWRWRGRTWRSCWSVKDWPGRRGSWPQGQRASQCACEKDCKCWNAPPGNTSAACGLPLLLTPPHRRPHEAVVGVQRRWASCKRALGRGCGMANPAEPRHAGDGE